MISLRELNDKAKRLLKLQEVLNELLTGRAEATILFGDEEEAINFKLSSTQMISLVTEEIDLLRKFFEDHNIDYTTR